MLRITACDNDSWRAAFTCYLHLTRRRVTYRYLRDIRHARRWRVIDERLSDIYCCIDHKRVQIILSVGGCCLHRCDAIIPAAAAVPFDA